MKMKLQKNKKGFALFTTLFLVVLFTFLSYRIVENNIIKSQLNTLKYLHLQANIHLDYIKEYVTNNSEENIDSFVLYDERYIISINKKNESNTTVYYLSVETSDDTHIRLSDKIIK